MFQKKTKLYKNKIFSKQKHELTNHIAGRLYKIGHIVWSCPPSIFLRLLAFGVTKQVSIKIWHGRDRGKSKF